MSDDDFIYGNDTIKYYFADFPTDAPSANSPTVQPSSDTAVPTAAVTVNPSTARYNVTNSPSAAPSISPVSPSSFPTIIPTSLPTVNPSELPTAQPTVASTVSIPTMIPTPRINATIATAEQGSHRHPNSQIALIIVVLAALLAMLVALILRFHERRDRTAARRSNIRYAEYLGEDFDAEDGRSTTGLVQMPVAGGRHAGTWARPPTPSGGGGGGGTTAEVPTAMGVIGGQSLRRTKYSVVDPASMDKQQHGGVAASDRAAAGVEENERDGELDRGDGWLKYETSNPMNPFK